MSETNEPSATQIPSDLKYSREHEWVRLLDDQTAEIGITDYAQDALGDIVFVELPESGAAVTADNSMGEVESTKSVSDIYAPVSGSVTEVNQALDETPELINSDPYGKGWLCRVKLSDSSGMDALMSAGDYGKFIGTL